MTDRLELVHETAAAITAAIVGPESAFAHALARLHARRLTGEDVVLVFRRLPDGGCEIEVAHRSILECAGSA